MRNGLAVMTLSGLVLRCANEQDFPWWQPSLVRDGATACYETTTHIFVARPLPSSLMRRNMLKPEADGTSRGENAMTEAICAGQWSQVEGRDATKNGCCGVLVAASVCSVMPKVASAMSAWEEQGSMMHASAVRQRTRCTCEAAKVPANACVPRVRATTVQRVWQ